jgi:large subunit ribosomal protein L29
MKLSEMREKTVDELKSAIIDWKKELLENKMKLATAGLENTALVSKTKRLIAQAKTVINEKAAAAAEVKNA